MGISRRQVLVSGGAGVGLLLAWELWPRHYAPNLVASPGETIFNAFLKIGEDGRVAIIACQSEMGQGAWTALSQMLADELGADWRTVAVEPAPINPLYANDFLAHARGDAVLPGFLRGVSGWVAHEQGTRTATMITGGSTTVRGFEARYREAGALARALLCKAAGKRWDAAWDACDTADGFVTHGDDRLRFGDIAAEAAALAPPDDVPLRAVGTGGLSGTPQPRLDLPSKVDGSARFAADVRLPDMVYAAVRHGPYGDTRLKQANEAAARAIPGMLAVASNPSWIAAVATNWWAANRALDAIRPVFATRGPLPDTASIAASLKQALHAKGKRFAGHGDVAAALAGPQVQRAEYEVPVALHAAVEPLAATARITGDRLELWVPTQAPVLARAAAARAIGFAENQVTVFPMFIGGGYGRNFETDAAVQAAILARQIKRPVQVIWSRVEETRRDPARPPALARMAATLGKNGVAAWDARIAAPATAAELERRLRGGSDGQDRADAAAVSGATPPYAIPAFSITHHPADIGIPTGYWRSAADSYTCFFTEAFLDELAATAGVEPLSFRMQMLGGQPRLAHCLTTVTALGDWDGGVAGSGQGIAAYSGLGSHIAVLAEAHVEKGGGIAVDRLFAVADVGRVVNPDLVRQQLEGGLIWGLAAALGSTTGFTAGMADARGFDTLALPTLATTPEIRVELVESRDAPGGASELAVPPVAPAIANALFSATGRRFRRLPLDGSEV
ncbi:MAG TPA: molybdopterin cofactor-binding domain-containing protein [Sphingomonadaceae bacterium]|nr:molybdopterin cofactor-binding domain-containing protein [Sphingomonadaceae bacterium]